MIILTLISIYNRIIFIQVIIIFIITIITFFIIIIYLKIVMMKIFHNFQSRYQHYPFRKSKLKSGRQFRTLRAWSNSPLVLVLFEVNESDNYARAGGTSKRHQARVQTMEVARARWYLLSA